MPELKAVAFKLLYDHLGRFEKLRHYYYPFGFGLSKHEAAICISLDSSLWCLRCMADYFCKSIYRLSVIFKTCQSASLQSINANILGLKNPKQCSIFKFEHKYQNIHLADISYHINTNMSESARGLWFVYDLFHFLYLPWSFQHCVCGGLQLL